MTAKEIRKLQTIIGKVESLQAMTSNATASARLQTAKSELIRLLQEITR